MSLFPENILSIRKLVVPLLFCSFMTGCKEQAPALPEVHQKTTPFIPLNERVTNADSELPEFKKLDEQIERFMKQWELSGASVAIMRNDSLLFCKGYGYADKEKEEKTEVKHLFRVASVSKLITAVAVMKLCEEGKLNLSDRIFGEEGIMCDSTYLNFRDSKLKQITVEHLLRHQGGFSRRQGDPLFEPVLVSSRIGKSTPFRTDDLVDFVLQGRLGFYPGSYASYSNLGYALLEKVIEKVAGRSYENYVREHVLRVAGCENMYIGNSHSQEALRNEVHYYEPSDAELVPDQSNPDRLVRKSDGGNDIRLLGAAGGWIASPIELARFVASINGNPNGKQVISPRSVRLMTDENKNGFPLGWMGTNSKGEWKRTGTLAGTSAMIRYKKEGFTYIFVTNTSTWRGANFTHDINVMMNRAISKVKEWPARDLFEK